MQSDTVTWDFPANETRPPTVRSLESNLQLFFDEWLIDEMDGVSLRLHYPHPQEIALELDRPWEGPASGVGLEVLHDEGRYRMWYVGFTEGDQRRTCYAESEDGIVWERPNLGLIEFGGSKENNLVMEADTGWNLCPFRDGQRFQIPGTIQGGCPTQQQGVRRTRVTGLYIRRLHPLEDAGQGPDHRLSARIQAGIRLAYQRLLGLAQRLLRGIHAGHCAAEVAGHPRSST